MSLRLSFAASASLLLLICLTGNTAQADVFEEVPEAAGYELVYSIDLPPKGNFFANGVPYEVDNRAAWNGNFDRIAYYLRLVRAGQEPQFIFVSGNTFTRSGIELGFPLDGLGFFHQTHFRDITVVSNVDGIVTGERLDGGYVEMWPGDYATSNDEDVPNASDAVYDFGDSHRDGRGYGCFQVHNYEARQTLFAFNRWNDGSNADLGIGNNQVPRQGSIHLDWTFRSNAGEYVERRLEVLVRPGVPPPPETIELTSPLPCSVTQRQAGNEAQVFVSGRSSVAADEVIWRLEPQDDEEPAEWLPLGGLDEDQTFQGYVSLPGGSHAIQVRTLQEGTPVGQLTVRQIGVGEVFIIAGQSNSANHGQLTMVPTDSRVCAPNGETWQLAADPQPMASGEGGSPWPAMGDRLAERFNVPVGIMSVGWGGTAVEQWLPGNPRNLFPRLQRATDYFGENGVRAILWHQGESNAVRRTNADVYAGNLSALIAAIRRHAGWEVPWGIARASYLPGAPAEGMAGVIAGQNAVIADVDQAFAGPETDDLIGEEWRWDGVHFNENGLREHGRRWAESIQLPQCQGFPGVVNVMPCEDPENPDAGVLDAGVPLDAGPLVDDAALVDAEVFDADTGDGEMSDADPLDQGQSDAGFVPVLDAVVTPDAVPVDDASADGGDTDSSSEDADVQDALRRDSTVPMDDGSVVDMSLPMLDQGPMDATMVVDMTMALDTLVADTAGNDGGPPPRSDAASRADLGQVSDDVGSAAPSDPGCDCSTTEANGPSQRLLGAILLLLGLRRRRSFSRKKQRR